MSSLLDAGKSFRGATEGTGHTSHGQPQDGGHFHMRTLAEHTVLGGQHTGQPRPVLKVNHANVAPCYLQRDLDERLNVLLKDSPRRSVLMIDSEKTGNDGG